MNRARVKEWTLIAVATGLLAFEAIALMGAAKVLAGVRERVGEPRVRVMTVERIRDRVAVRTLHRHTRTTKACDRCADQVRDAVEAAVRAAL